MQETPSLTDKLQRHRDFWARRPTDRPMIGIGRPLGKTAPGFDLLGDRILALDDVNERLYQAYKHCTTVCTPCADHPGDLFYTTIPHMVHTHSVGLPVMIDALLDTPELACIECTVDAGGPTLDELLPLWRRVLEGGKSLLVCLEEATPEVDRVIAELPAAGLAVSVSTDNPPEYDYLMGNPGI